MFMPQNIDHLSLEQKVQLLLDEREIQNLHHRYARAIDRVDMELFRTCFFEDAIDHHSPMFECTGKELFDIVENNAFTNSLGLKYMVNNLLIEVDGNTARTESVIFSITELHDTNDQGQPMLYLAPFRYLDRLEKRNGEWRIAERWYVAGPGMIHSTAPIPRKHDLVLPKSEPQMSPPIVSQRDRTDKSYHM